MAKNTPTPKPSEEDVAINTLFREVDDDLRQDKATQLWKRFGGPLIGGIVLAIVAVGAYEGWNAYDRQAREALGNRFDQALTLIRDQKGEEARPILKELQAEESGYARLASMQEAALLAEQGQPQAAADAYIALVDQIKDDPAQQDLARLLGGLNALNAGNATQALEVLKPLKDSGRALRHSAAEIVAYAHAETGDKAKAHEIMAQLAEDASVPAGLRARAGEFVQVYAQ